MHDITPLPTLAEEKILCYIILYATINSYLTQLITRRRNNVLERDITATRRQIFGTKENKNEKVLKL